MAVVHFFASLRAHLAQSIVPLRVTSLSAAGAAGDRTRTTTRASKIDPIVLIMQPPAKSSGPAARPLSRAAWPTVDPRVSLRGRSARGGSLSFLVQLQPARTPHPVKAHRQEDVHHLVRDQQPAQHR